MAFGGTRNIVKPLLSHQALGSVCENGGAEQNVFKGRTIDKLKLVVFGPDTNSIREEVALVPCNLGQ